MPKKVDQYDNERKEIVCKLFNLLGINDINNMFSLHKIDNDDILQENILALEPEIKKYFLCSRWPCFRKDYVDRKWLSMVKNIFKDMKYQIISSKKRETVNDIPKVVSVYHIINIDKNVL
jgi:hypothetical protein